MQTSLLTPRTPRQQQHNGRNAPLVMLVITNIVLVFLLVNPFASTKSNMLTSNKPNMGPASTALSLIPPLTTKPILSPTWDPFLPLDALQRGFLYAGNGCRIQSLLQKLQKGNPITALTLGGSVTYGSGVPDKDTEAYPALFFHWLNTTFPPSMGSHTFINAGRGGQPSNSYATCLSSFIPKTDIDLIVLEFAVNDEAQTSEGLDAVARKKFETLVRSVLQLPGKPAVFVLNYYSWWVAYKGKRRGSGSYYGDNGNEAREDELAVIGRYYDVPVLSVKAAIYPLMAAGFDGFKADKIGNNQKALAAKINAGSYGNDWKPYFYADLIHPNKNGHQALADLLIFAIHQYAMSSQSCTFGMNGLPPVMIKNNLDVAVCGCFLNPKFFGTWDDSIERSNATGAGFKYAPQLPQHTLPRAQKWGWIANQPGSWLEVGVPTAACYDHKNSTTILSVGYMRSYQTFGKAAVRCQRGCRCKGMTLDATWSDKSTQIDTTSMEIVSEKGFDSCTLHVENLNDTASGGHKFVLMYVQLGLPIVKGHEEGAWREWIGVA